jgi:hypothetical protein
VAWQPPVRSFPSLQPPNLSSPSKALRNTCRLDLFWEKTEAFTPRPDSLRSSPSPCARLSPKVHYTRCSPRDTFPSLLGECVELQQKCRRRLQKQDQRTCAMARYQRTDCNRRGWSAWKETRRAYLEISHGCARADIVGGSRWRTRTGTR